MTIRSARRVLGAVLATSMLAGWAAPALAQDAPAPDAADTADPTDSGEIVVSARRRDETLQTTPIAITAINSAMLENKAAVNIGDLQGAAPNLMITQQNTGAQAANLSIRGMTYADIEKSQEPTVGVVIDGVFVGTNTGQLLDFFDIEQIEVLRGPQGTLFGRNTIGGVLSIRRSRPTMVTGVKVEGSYSSWNSWATRAVVNLGDGQTFGIKGWYFHNESDGFYHNAFTNRSAGGSKNDNFGASLLVEPQGSGFDALLTVENVHQVFDPTNATLAQTGELFCVFQPAVECDRNNTTDLYTVFTSPGVSRYSAPSVTLAMNYDAGPVKLTSITGWRHSSEYQTQDFDSSSADLYYSLRQQHYTQWSQELRAAGKIGTNFDYVVGGFYFNSKFDLTQWTRFFGFDPTLDPQLADPDGHIVTGRTESIAVFGDFNWAFADKWRLSFGGRYTHDHKELTNGYLISGALGAGSASFAKFTPKVGIDFRPNDEVMLYASWSRGFRSGGFSPRAATAATASVAYEPEIVDSYEVGGKFSLFDRRLQLNLAGFVAKYKNLQQSTTVPGGPLGNQTVITNAGSATIKGFEADATIRPAEGLKITATLALLDSKFQDFIASNLYGAAFVPFDYSANNMIFAPKFSASINAEYTQRTSFGSLVGAIGLRHIDPYDQQISLGTLTPVIVAGTVTKVIVNGNDPRVRTPAQNLLDASLTAKFKLASADAYLTVFGRNLLNERLAGSSFTVAGLWAFASAIEPRSYGVTLGVKF